MAVTNNIDNSVLFCQRKISGFRSFEKIKKSFKYVFLVSIILLSIADLGKMALTKMLKLLVTKHC